MGIRWMRPSHARAAISVRFDDPNLVSRCRAGGSHGAGARHALATLLAERLTITAKGGANAAAKILAQVAGMVCGRHRPQPHPRPRALADAATAAPAPPRSAPS
jgi:hypothetical protein